MTPEFESDNNHKPHSSEDSLSGNLENSPLPLGKLDMQKRDRFELISAYLDGEVTAAERRQVQEWLATDPQAKSMYNRLLKVRQALRTMPAPPAESVEQTVEQVFAKLDRRPTVEQVFAKLDRCPKRAFSWGGAAIAALFVGALATVLPIHRSLNHQFAFSPDQETTAEPVMIALNEPLVTIPKAAIAQSEKSLQQPSVNLQQPLLDKNSIKGVH